MGGWISNFVVTLTNKLPFKNWLKLGVFFLFHLKSRILINEERGRKSTWQEGDKCHYNRRKMGRQQNMMREWLVQQMLLVPCPYLLGPPWTSPTASGDHFRTCHQLSAQEPMLLFLEKCAQPRLRTDQRAEGLGPWGPTFTRWRTAFMASAPQPPHSWVSSSEGQSPLPFRRSGAGLRPLLSAVVTPSGTGFPPPLSHFPTHNLGFLESPPKQTICNQILI